MNRSGGVTASAVIAIIGSVFAILFGGFAILAALMMRIAPNLPAPPLSPATLLFAESIVHLGFGAWGIASAVGLLRLKNWARICFLVYAGLLCFFSAMGVLGLSMAMILMPQMMPPQQNVPPGLMTAVFSTMIIFALLQVALGIWWLVYFNRRDVKAQFMGEAGAAASSRRPLSITIIAWLMVIGGLFAPFYLFVNYPAMIFGFVVRGWEARTLYLLLTLLNLLAGIGLLRMRAAAHSLTVGYCGFGLLNIATSILLPGSFARMQAFMREVYPLNSPQPLAFTEQIFWFCMLFGIVVNGVLLWLLITRRQAFLNACKAPPPA